jgi:microcystin degradation protein MlrC
MRIAIASLKHESDPSVSTVSMMEAFTGNHFYRDQEILAGVNNPGAEMLGFIGVLRQAGADIVSLIATDGGSGGPVMRETFHVLAVELVHRLAARRPVDGMLLALSASTAVEDEQDAAGELLERVRNVLPPGTPIGVTLGPREEATPRMHQPGVFFVGQPENMATSQRELAERTAHELLEAVANRMHAPTSASGTEPT